MKKIITTITLFATCFASINAQNTDTKYSEKVRVNATNFHQNFSTGDFDKNGPLVNDKIYVNSNNAIVIGRDKFVARIKRFHTPFPTLKLKDRIIIVDENNVGLLYIMQGTQDGPYGAIPPGGKKINVYAAEFFTMDDEAKMKELLTITQLDHLVKQIKGDENVNEYETVSMLPIAKSDVKNKKLLKKAIESYVQNFNSRDWNALDALLDNNVKVNWNGKIGAGKQAVKEGLNKYTTILPDLTFHLERNVVEGNRGALAYTMIGISNADNKSQTKRVEAKEGAHFLFNKAGKIIEMVVVSNTDDIQNQLK
ncbi:putative ester cyclase [Chryseobacterium ginsenosidimutans]|uniref:nuclear transport factor 2 family protein n=1 Tax=Chryseobacterium ginsenosidimutans TaxID=687846 RepID=UPI002167D577|nr:nuclear transport factor 2 family protein [Chryseobacterium ginsenosidimutans]MCS3868167.1 putative ester cyclase [Chryseobacterium ginsenosidimutans]